MRNHRLIRIFCVFAIAAFLFFAGIAFGVDSLFVNNNGNVGIGTNKPLSNLDVVGYAHFSGNTNPTVTSQGAYIGWNALTGGTGETDFINNQGLGAGGFAFMNTPNSGTPKTTLMFITGTGNVGIGTETPQSMLHIKKANGTWGEVDKAGLKLENPSLTATADIFLDNFWVDFLSFEINDIRVFWVNEFGDAAIGDVFYSSDINLKEDVKTLNNSLKNITKLSGVSYKWKDKKKKGDKLHIGLVAQEVEKVYPEAVTEDKEGNKLISYSQLVAPLIEAVKELKAENDELKKGYADLLARVEALEKKK